MKNFGLIFSMILVSTFTSAQIIHIPGEYTSIQAGINAAVEGDTVLVAEGTYLENINFLGKPITVASHFILDGDTAHISKTVIDGSQPTHPDTASVVIMFSGEDTTSVLNGFTITGGKGTRVDTKGFGFQRTGGGVAIGFCGGKIVNNHISGNSLNATGIEASGGGISAVEQEGIKSIVIRNNRVSGNEITSNTYAQGGGIFTGSEGALSLIENNEVKGNKATCTGTWKANAGGIMLGSTKPWEASLVVRDNLIIENEIHCVASQGGGIFLTFPSLGSGYQSGTAGIEIYNNIIANNFSEDRGGGVAIWDQRNGAYEVEHPIPLMYNNTIVGNTANEGAGLFNFEMNALLFNNIIWNDTANGAEEIYLKDINYSVHLTNHGKFQSWFNNIRGGYDGIGNINQDPMLNSETFMLAENSPCVGRGMDSIYIAGFWYHAPEFDFSGSSRLMASPDMELDMGALESPYDRPKTDYDSDHIINVPGKESSIQAGIDAAVDGDTVLVEEGYYFENINFNGKAIMVASRYILDNDEAHITQTVIDGSQASDPDKASVVKFDNCMDTTSVLAGFTVTGGKGTLDFAIDQYGRSGGGIYMYNAGGKVTHNIVTGNSIEEESDYGFAGGIGIADYTGGNFNAVLRNNLIYNNYTTASGFSMGAGINAFIDGGFLLIENNEVFNNTSTCTASYKALGAGMNLHKYYGHSGHMIVRNNNIHHNEALCEASMGGGIYLVYDRMQTGENLESNVPAEIYNNIIADNYSEDKGGGIGIWNMAPIYGLNQKVPDPILSNNTIINNRASDGPGIFNYDAETVLFNNIFWNQVTFTTAHEVFNEAISYPGHYPKSRNDGIIHSHFNIFKQPLSPEDQVTASYNNYIDPTFESNATFELSEASPAIGRGTDSLEVKGKWYYAQPFALNGNTRPDGADSFVDPGAFESPFSRMMLSTADLASIAMSGTHLIPPFSSAKLKYILRMPENFDYVNGLIAIPEDALAEMEINHATDIFSENIDDRSTTIAVTSSDGTASKIYQVEFRPLSTDASLSALSLSQGSLDPEFDPGIFTYVTRLPAGTTEAPEILYETSNEYATVEITNALDLTKPFSADRTSRVDVTAQDGVTKSIYRIEFAVGIEDNYNTGDLKIYPNPFSTSATLAWRADNCINRIDLLDMTGKLVLVIDKIAGNAVTLYRGNLPPGLYFLRVYGDETSVMKLVIK